MKIDFDGIGQGLAVIAVVWGLVQCHKIDTEKEMELLRLKAETSQQFDENEKGKE